MVNWTAIWFVLFVLAYLAFFVTLYKAYLRPMLLKFKHKEMYLRYVILDTGETDRVVFNQNDKTIVSGVARIYNRERVQNGIIYYESGNAEPLRVEQDISRYSYFCDTKNFDTISRNTILETLMILNAKQILMILLFVCMFLIIIAAIAQILIMEDAITGLQTQIQAVHALVNSTVQVQP